MNQPIECENFNDENGNPAGGYVKGTGIEINWQDGPLGRGPDRKEPNGAFVESVISAAIQRIEYYQESKFACIENQIALDHLIAARAMCNFRTEQRERRQVEGTHTK